MDYKVLYRKYRPTNFDELVGQEHVKKILKNSVINNKIAHAYMFYIIYNFSNIIYTVITSSIHLQNIRRSKGCAGSWGGSKKGMER